MNEDPLARFERLAEAARREVLPVVEVRASVLRTLRTRAAARTAAEHAPWVFSLGSAALAGVVLVAFQLASADFPFVVLAATFTGGLP